MIEIVLSCDVHATTGKTFWTFYRSIVGAQLLQNNAKCEPGENQSGAHTPYIYVIYMKKVRSHFRYESIHSYGIHYPEAKVTVIT
jgi:hypothetical protein